jgi:hypothetical protein
MTHRGKLHSSMCALLAFRIVWMLNNGMSSQQLSYHDNIKYQRDKLSRIQAGTERGDAKLVQAEMERLSQYLWENRVLTQWPRPPLAIVADAGDTDKAIAALRRYIMFGEGRIMQGG